MNKETSSVPQYVFSAFVIALYVIFLVYLFKLEKIGCKCALNWRRNYMIIFLIFALTSNFLSMFIPAIKLNILLILASSVLSLMFVIISIQYVQKVKADKCDCSEHLTREIMYCYSWIMLVLFILSFTLSFYILYRLYSLQRKSQ
jgi:hypothetical protein